jgi:hypothetical protein
VADANEVPGEDVDEESSQELIGGDGHDLLLAAVGIVLPAEGDAAIVEGYETMVGDWRRDAYSGLGSAAPANGGLA